MNGKTGTIVWTTDPRHDDGIYEICVEFDVPHGDLDDAGMLWDCNDLTPIGNGRYGYAVSVELIGDDDETEVTGLEELLLVSRKGGA